MAKTAAKIAPTPEVKKATPGQTLVSIKSQEQAVAARSSFEAYAGAGLENVTSNDLVIPRITILQALSPQVQPKKAEFIEGAKIGDICDVGSGELFDEPLLFLPVHYMKQWLQWAPRASGRGLVKIHNTAEIFDECTVDEKGKHITDEGDVVLETAQFFGLNLSAHNRRSFVPLASTQLKKSKKWLTLSTSEKVKRADGSIYTPPLFYRIYELTTVEESNTSGDWIGWKIERGQRLEELDNFKEIFDEAVQFRDSVKKGETRGDVSTIELEAEEENAGERKM